MKGVARAKRHEFLCREFYVPILSGLDGRLGPIRRHGCWRLTLINLQERASQPNPIFRKGSQPNTLGPVNQAPSQVLIFHHRSRMHGLSTTDLDCHDSLHNMHSAKTARTTPVTRTSKLLRGSFPFLLPKLDPIAFRILEVGKAAIGVDLGIDVHRDPGRV